MKKTYTLILIFICALCMQSCKNETPIKPVNSKIYLLKKIADETGTINEFTYDDKNRLVDVNYVVGGYEYKYTYDAQDRLAEAKIYDQHSAAILNTSTYLYSADRISVSKYNNTVNTTDKYYYELSNGRITKGISESDGSGFIYTNDSKGNIIKVQSLSKDGKITNAFTCTYDNKKSPFSMMKGLNLHFWLAGLEPVYGVINNITALEGTNNTTYKYNDDGFPVSAVVKFPPYTDTNLTYEYIVK